MLQTRLRYALFVRWIYQKVASLVQPARANSFLGSSRLFQLLSVPMPGSFVVIKHLANAVRRNLLLSVLNLAAVRKLQPGSPPTKHPRT